MNSKVVVVIGPMFSGKSTLLVNYATKDQQILNKKVLIIGSSRDTRSKNKLQTHTGTTIEYDYLALNLKELFENQNYHLLQSADTVIIDEGHFYDDLYEFVYLLLCMYEKESLLKRSVYIAGLYDDFNGVPFENMVRVMTLASEKIFINSLCVRCKDGTEALYSKRHSDQVITSDRLVPGGKESYIPVCRKHFFLNQ